MNLAKLRENIGKALKFYPRPKTGDIYITEPRNRWILVSEEKKGLAVLNVLTNHEFFLPFDSIRDYREPEILILRSQVVLSDNGGVELVPFVDAHTDTISPVATTKFQGLLSVGWSPRDFVKELRLPVTSIEGLPSRKAEESIRSALTAKLQLRAAGVGEHVLSLARLTLGESLFGPLPYEARSVETLEENLANVKETYEQHDAYELFEARAHKLNVHLLNEGNEYIEDASIQLDFERCRGLIIAKEIISEPRDRFSLVMDVPFTPRLGDSYPQVDEAAEGYSVYKEFGPIKHGLPMEAFETPLRIVVAEHAKGQMIKVHCVIRGKTSDLIGKRISRSKSFRQNQIGNDHRHFDIETHGSSV